MVLLLLVLILSLNPLLTELDTLETANPTNSMVVFLNTIMPTVLPVMILIYAGVTLYVGLRRI